MQEIKQLSQTLGQLHKSLTDDFQHEEKWMGGTYFIVSNFRPKADKAQTIVAKALEAKLQVAEPDDNLAITKQELASATFALREFSRFAPEVGAGLVVSFVDRPKYGTATNGNGQVIVARIRSDSVSIDPTVMLNFVCRYVPPSPWQPAPSIGRRRR